MLTNTKHGHTYKVGRITFIVTPVYSPERGDTMYSILLKMMKSDVLRRKAIPEASLRYCGLRGII